MRSRPPLVLLHGWGLNRGVFTGVTDLLEPSFEVRILDLPGYREPYRGHYRLPDLARNLLARAPRNATWVGWSLGGMVAIEAALAAPERIDRLVLVATTPRFVNAAGWRCGVDVALLRRFCRDLKADYGPAMHRFLLLQCAGLPGARRLARRVAADVLRCGQVAPQVLDAGLELLGCVDLRRRLGDLTPPTTVIHGNLDRITPPDAGRYLAAQVPGARYQALPAGHAPFLSHPEDFVDAVAAR